MWLIKWQFENYDTFCLGLIFFFLLFPTPTPIFLICNSQYTFFSFYRLTEIKAFYDCVPGKNQICDKTGHVICTPGYYGPACSFYCNATMFENCNCTLTGELQCSEQPVGVFFDLHLISTHIPEDMNNLTYTLFIELRFEILLISIEFHF